MGQAQEVRSLGALQVRPLENECEACRDGRADHLRVGHRPCSALSVLVS